MVEKMTTQTKDIVRFADRECVISTPKGWSIVCVQIPRTPSLALTLMLGNGKEFRITTEHFLKLSSAPALAGVDIDAEKITIPVEKLSAIRVMQQGALVVPCQLGLWREESDSLL